MTGLEGMAGAAAAGAARVGNEIVKSKVSTSRLEQKALVEAATRTPGFELAAEIRGRRLALKEQWGLVILRPVARLMGVSPEYFNTAFAEDFGAAIADIPEDNLQTPKAIVAGPALEGLAYTLDEPDLKEMYLKLIATASDDRISSSAHPSFSEIIRQLSAEEAVLLKSMSWEHNQLQAIVNVRVTAAGEEGGRTVFSNITVFNNDDPFTINYADTAPTYLDNWRRLGLVELDYTTHITDPSDYDWVEKHPQIISLRAYLAGDKFAEDGIVRSVDVVKGVMRVTAFGRSFATAVGLAEPVAPA
jgi:hypothetical protein